MKQLLLLSLVSVLVVGCGISKDKYTTLENQMKTCEQNLMTATTARKTCEEQLNTVASTKEELEEKTKTYEDLMNSLKDEVNAGKIKISEMQDRLTVNLIDKILFSSGSTKIKGEGQSALAKIADVLKKLKDKRVQVEGHTDNVPVGPSLQQKFPTNWELSTSRATVVARYLADAGVPAEKLSAAGYSKFSPVAPNESEEGRSQNRRIEIVLVPEIKRQPVEAVKEEKTE